MLRGFLIVATCFTLTACNQPTPVFDVEITTSTSFDSAWIRTSPNKICYEKITGRNEYACVEPSKPYNQLSVFRIGDEVRFRTRMDSYSVESLSMEVVYPKSTRP